MEKNLYEINAEGKILGRLASEVAIILRGRNSPSFQPNIAPKVEVKISNVEKIKLSGNKLNDKEYKRFSGYPGGLKTIKFETMLKNDPNKLFLKVVRGMLPKNKLRKEMLKNIKFA